MITPETQYVYKPSLLRLIFFFVCIPILFVLLGWSTRLVIDYSASNIGNLGQQVSSIGITTLTYAVMSFIFLLLNKDQFVVTINPKILTGPANVSLIGNLETFPIERIDREKLMFRTFWEKFWHKKVIWSKDGEKIIISRFCYSREQEQEIIQNLLSLSQVIM